jgi:hypothetical protein
MAARAFQNRLTSKLKRHKQELDIVTGNATPCDVDSQVLANPLQTRNKKAP